MRYQEKNRKALKRSIQELKTQSAPGFIWENINTEINFPGEKNRAAFIQATKQLPNYKLEVDLWQEIDSNINKKIPIKHYNNYFVLKIAAAIIILFGISFMLRNQSRNAGQIVITTTINEDNFYQPELNSNNGPGIQQEIDLLCSTLPENCELPIIKELQTQLNEVSIQYEELKTMVIQSSNPDLLKYLHRIENEKYKIEKELLTLIINT